MTEMPEYFISLADHNFNTHKLWKQKDEDNYLFEIRESIIKRLEEIFATKRAINELS